jgi:hypothetical protein
MVFSQGEALKGCLSNRTRYRSRLGRVGPPRPLKPGVPRPIIPAGLTLPRLTHPSPFPSFCSLFLPLSSPFSLLFFSSFINKLRTSPLHSNQKHQKKKNARHNPNLLPRPIGREPRSPHLRMGQTGCSRRPSAQTTERAVREFSAEDVEVDDGKGAVSTRWACCCVELLYVCIHLVMNIHGAVLTTSARAS